MTEQALENDISLEDLEANFAGLQLEIRETVAFKPARKPFDGRNPYRGLEKFTEADHEFFFGRAAAVAALTAMIQALIEQETTPQTPALLAVIGASGGGKSSLVRAGLIPALRTGQIASSQTWPIRVMLPGPDPIEALAKTFVPLTGRGLRALLDDLRRDEQGLHYLIEEALAAQEATGYLALVIDQFEELFTLCDSEAERRDFINLLLYEATHPRSHGLIILTMRADFYGRASHYPRLAQALTARQLLVTPLTPRELREAVLLPAEAVGLELEKEAALALVQETANAPGALPLLQHALLELFNRRSEDDVLTMAAYQEIGGVRGALAHRAEAVFNRLTPQQQDLARNIFLRLTSLGEGVSDTRRRVSRAELYPAGADAAAVDAVLQALSGKEARLIVADAATVEVTHEALIQQWGRLRAWLEANRDSLRLHRRVTEAAREWAANDRDASYLFRGARLAEVEAWVADHGGEALTPEEWAFVSAGLADRERAAQAEEDRRRQELAQANKLRQEAEARRKAEEERAQEAEQRSVEQARATKRLRRLLAGLALLLLIAVGVTVYALQQQNIATARQFAAEGQLALADKSYRLTTLLALEANRLDDREGSGLLTELATQMQPQTLTQLTEHSGGVNSVAWSPDGRYLASGSADGSVVIWEAETGQTQRLTEHSDLVNSLAWSPDGRYLASGSEDASVVIWEVETGQTQRLTKHSDLVNSVAWSPNGRYLVSMSWLDNSVVIWEAETGQSQRLTEYYSAAWSPDGRYLVLGSRVDAGVVIWEAETGQIQRLTEHSALDFIIWEAETEQAQWLMEYSVPVLGVFWSPIIPQNKRDIVLAYAVRSEVRLLQEAFIHSPCEWGMLNNFSLDEWKRYRGNAIYHATCPNLRSPTIPRFTQDYFIHTLEGRIIVGAILITGLVIIVASLWGLYRLTRWVYRRALRGSSSASSS